MTKKYYITYINDNKTYYANGDFDSDSIECATYYTEQDASIEFHSIILQAKRMIKNLQKDPNAYEPCTYEELMPMLKTKIHTLRIHAVIEVPWNTTKERALFSALLFAQNITKSLAISNNKLAVAMENANITSDYFEGKRDAYKRMNKVINEQLKEIK